MHNDDVWYDSDKKKRDPSRRKREAQVVRDVIINQRYTGKKSIKVTHENTNSTFS
jgi:hypothetical protein